MTLRVANLFVAGGLLASAMIFLDLGGEDGQKDEQAHESGGT